MRGLAALLVALWRLPPEPRGLQAPRCGAAELLQRQRAQGGVGGAGGELEALAQAGPAWRCLPLQVFMPAMTLVGVGWCFSYVAASTLITGAPGSLPHRPRARAHASRARPRCPRPEPAAT